MAESSSKSAGNWELTNGYDRSLHRQSRHALRVKLAFFFVNGLGMKRNGG
jgi:hypothetical protein